MKDERITFRASDEEKELLNNVARAAGLNLSSFVRYSSLEKAKKLRKDN